MAKRKLGILLAVLAFSVAGLTGSSPSGASDLPGATACVVAGTVAFAGPTDSSLPPPVGPGGSGPINYNFNSVLIACAGSVTGAGTAGSGGSTCGTSPTGCFSGTFGANFLGTGQACTGAVGGPAAPGALPPGPWSFSVGPIIVGGLTNVDCTPIVDLGVAHVGGHTDAFGVLALVGAPDPTASPGCFGLLFESPLNPNIPTGLQYCGIVVAGAAVIVD